MWKMAVPAAHSYSDMHPKVLCALAALSYISLSHCSHLESFYYFISIFIFLLFTLRKFNWQIWVVYVYHVQNVVLNYAHYGFIHFPVCYLPGFMWLPASGPNQFYQGLGTARWDRSGVWQSLKIRDMSNNSGVTLLVGLSNTSNSGYSWVPYLAWGGSQGPVVHMGKSAWNSYVIGSGSPRKEPPQPNGPGTQGPTRKCLWHRMHHCAAHGFLWLTGQSSPAVSPLPWDVRVSRVLNLESRLCSGRQGRGLPK